MADTPPLPLLFLYTDSRAAIEGATRFQKLVFLAQEETDLGAIYEFRADRFGPYSGELASDLEKLVAGGYVNREVVTNEYGRPKIIYSLTTDGIQKARSLLQTVANEDAVALIEDVKRQWNDEPVQKLLQYVYRKYASYTTATDLDMAMVVDPDAETAFETRPPADTTDPTLGETLQPTPHTLWQMPKREANAYFYYFTDAPFTETDSKYKPLDDTLTLLGRNRAQLEVAIIDRDSGIPPAVWDVLVDGFGLDDYPALVVAESELGVRDVDRTADSYSPSGRYATLEAGIIQDDILSDDDDLRAFLNTLFDAAREGDIEARMRREKMYESLTIGRQQLESILSVTTGPGG